MTISSVLDELPAEASIESEARSSAPRFEKRQRIVLSCAQCGGRNYRKTKARREGAGPLQLKKFCHTCNGHTQHREAI